MIHSVQRVQDGFRALSARKTNTNMKAPVILCTGLSASRIHTVIEATRRLGGEFKEDVSPEMNAAKWSATHLICKTQSTGKSAANRSKRTLKYLAGVVGQSWVVNEQ